MRRLSGGTGVPPPRGLGHGVHDTAYSRGQATPRGGFQPMTSPIRIVTAVILDRAGRVLVVRKRGSRAFIQPGGKREAGEQALHTLARELREELGVALRAGGAHALGTFEDDAVNEPGRRVQGESFLVQVDGTPRARRDRRAGLDSAAPAAWRGTGAVERTPCTAGGAALAGGWASRLKPAIVPATATDSASA